MSDTPQGETAKTEEPKNDGSNASTSNGNASDPAEAERLRKEAEQARMRANQLENELKAIREKEEEAKQKQLEEQNEWKQVAEQKDARLKELEREREEAELKEALQKKQSEVFSEFSDEVRELAEDAGVSLQAADDEAAEKLRATLTKLSNRVGNSGSVTENNPNQPKPKQLSREELLAQHAKTPSPKLVDEAISQIAWVQSKKQQS